MTLLAVLCARPTIEKVLNQNKKGLFVVGSTIFLLGFIALGAFLFMTIESPGEKEQRQAVLNVKNKILKKYPHVSDEIIMEVYQELHQVGIKGLDVVNDTHWTFGNAFLFSTTLLTTVGYGHLSPVTAGGKIFSMLYSIVGIPLTLVTMGAQNDHMMSISNVFKTNLFNHLGTIFPFVVRLLHISIIMTVFTVGCFLLPAGVFFCIESAWTYLDSVYFCFISLTTVGLGDFVPGLAPYHPNIDVYRVGVSLFLLAGVSIMMFMLAALGDFIRNYNSPYTVLPLTVLTANKCPIKVPDPPAYGTMIDIPKEVDEKTKLLAV